MKVRQIGEHGWLRAVLPHLAAAARRRDVLVGPGDDAAVLASAGRPLVLTTDALREGVHFRSGWAPWPLLGRRAFRANASDLAAMGAVPRAALLALDVPPAMPVRALTAFVRGFAADARRHGAALVGGNVSRGARFGATVTLLGTLPGPAVTRDGARPGDTIFVTGRLGAAAFAVRALRAGRAGRLPLPPVRLRAGVRLASLASAMLDVSDGLVQDLGHLCRASHVAARRDLALVPCVPEAVRLGRAGRLVAATGGEDYELVFTVPAANLGRLARARLGCAVTPIGVIERGRSVRVVDAGRAVRVGRVGFDHLR
jgi:thiamine-monophosphate kinase